MNRILTFCCCLCLCGAALAQSGTVQIGFPGQFSGDFEYLNALPPGGWDLDSNGVFDIGRPCSCRPMPPIQNGSSNNAGVFDSWLVVATGVSGQTWRIQYADLALNPASLLPLPFGAIVPEVGNTGVYALHFAHRDAARYAFVLENTADFPGQSFGPFINTCYYPDPELYYLDDFYCDNSPGVLLYGSATSPFDENLLPVDPTDEIWTITRQQDGLTYSTAWFRPDELGQGHYRVRYTFDAGENAFYAANKTGCSVTVEAETTVRRTDILSCNNAINLTLNPVSCQAEVTPAMLLTFTPITYRGYRVDVLDPFGNPLGTVIPADYAFVPLLGVLTDECTGLYCTTQITARDVHAPVLTVPANRNISCAETPDTTTTGRATAVDCSLVQITYTDQTAHFPCGNPIARITRTWRATDIFGQFTTGVQTINIARGGQAQLRFPADLFLDCAQYAADPSLTDPTPGKAGIPNLVDIPNCGLIYAHSDDTLGLCGNTQLNFVILRTWLVLDACGFQVFNIDGLGNDNIQFIRVSDETPPVITAPLARMSAALSPLQTGLPECTSAGFIPPPQVSDACNNFQVRIFTPLGEAIYVNGSNGAAGAHVPFPGLPLGQHPITYRATDVCGNQSEFQGLIEVVDSLPPLMLCNNSINLTLSGTGTARVMPNVIDAGSRDDCCIGQRLLRLAGEPESAFRPFVDFTCPAVPSQQVVLRVSDCFGNFNECEATVHWVDPIPISVVSAPGPVAVFCQDDLTPYGNAAFQAPVFTDNCPFETTFQVQTNLNNCGIGTVQRTWTAGGAATVSQTVTVNGRFEYSFRLPNDLMAQCGAATVPDDVAILAQSCDQFVFTIRTDTITAGAPGHCTSIQRTIDWVNLCQTAAGTPPLTLPRQGGLDAGKGYDVRVQNGMVFQVAFDGSLLPIGPATGSYRYVQRWDVLDSAPPVFSFTAPPVFCTQTACNGEATFLFAASDNCAPALGIIRRVSFNGQSPMPDPGLLTALGNGQYRIVGQYPAGLHTLEIVLSDGCGNITTGVIPFEVRDCTLPVLVCRQDLVLSLETGGILELRPDLFPLQLTDNCPGGLLSFQPLALDTIRLMTCDSLGFRTVNIWLTDAAGNQAACQSNVEVLAGAGVCPEFWNISGMVGNENQLPVSGVSIRLSGHIEATEITPMSGQYEFFDLPGQRDYTLRPEKNINVSNGVSTFDLVLISRHILGVEALGSPYKIIAADVNRSGTVSTLDLILIRRVILGADTVFPNNNSWRFIPADFEFSISGNPFFGAGFPEEVVLPQLGRDTAVHFIAIKVGDVNSSANPQQ